MREIPRPEHPRPSWVREDWLNLNGEWRFAFDPGDSGAARGLVDAALPERIVVPFAPESELSGHGKVDFVAAVWYRREAALPEAWRGKRILLHFQAVEYDATVWVNGEKTATHRGGHTPFTCDLGVTDAATLAIVLRARDPNYLKPLGKQSERYGNYGCHYTRTTGIWQTVWLEAVPEVYLRRPRVTPERAAGRFRVEAGVTANRPGWRVRARLSAGGRVLAEDEVPADADWTPTLSLAVPADARREWSPDDPFLYDLALELLDADGNVVDRGETYAGLRSVTVDSPRLLLNGKPVFQRLVLDQGFYPDGIWTAPTDAALRRDIELSQAAGFNGARLHQRVFEERFLHHADRMGYLVWGEFPDWGFEKRGFVTDYPAPDRCQPGATLIAQWLEALERDYSHPALVGWCGLNESGMGAEYPDEILALDDITRGAFLAAKAADRTRPVLDVSGYSHRVAETDVYDTHDYEQDPAIFAEHYARLAEGEPFMNAPGRNLPYRGQPFFNSEFGGIRWNADKASGPGSWGYGAPPRTLEEFYARFEGLVAVLRDHPRMFGYCYTQLTDVFQEENGIYRFDRSAKFDVARLAAAQRRTAAYEGS